MNENLNRRRFIGALAAGAALAGCAKKPALDLEEATLASLQQAMTSGAFTTRSLAESYLYRIREIDKAGPALNAIIELNPDALSIADSLDQERTQKGPRGPLHGIPVLIKDNIDTADRMSTTAGSLALEGSIAKADAALVARLRSAGAVILGKTNLSEWANFRSTHSSSGWSGRGGQTRHPYALDRNPSGSSSGSAVAVAANLCAVAVGTETDGSIVSPSANCGVVGVKPTLGLIGGSGIIPIAHSQDTAGPMARTVTDAAILLRALAVPEKQQDFTQHLDPNGLKGARIGIARKFFGYNRDADRVMNTALDVLKKSGAELIDPVELRPAGEYGESEMEVLLYEFKADLNAYLGALGPAAKVHSLKELIDFNEKNRDREMPYFGQEILLMAEAKGDLSTKAYTDALAKNLRLTRAEGIDLVVAKHKLDAIFAPAGGPSWLTDLVTGDHEIGGSSSPAAVAGYPNITVPAGFVRGLPAGVSFFGPAWSEPKLLRIAYAFEQATRVRKVPRFLPAADLKNS